MEGNAGDMASGEAEGDEQRRGRQEGADAARATSRESVSTHTDKHTREMRVNTQYWVEMGGVVRFRAQRTHHPYTSQRLFSRTSEFDPLSVIERLLAFSAAII